MFNLQEALDSRLATLKGKRPKAIARKNNILDDVSVVSIKKSLTQAGIINKQGKLVKRVTIE